MLRQISLLWNAFGLFLILSQPASAHDLGILGRGDYSPEFRLALIGDTEAGGDFGQVLNLIASEKADAIMVNGDLGYNSSPDDWKRRLTKTLDVNRFPVIGSLGNHDLGLNTQTYISIFDELRTKENGLRTKCTGSTTLISAQDVTAVDEVCTFGNVSIVASAIGQVLTPSYLEARLESKLRSAPANNWKLVGYHFTLASMNPGIKGDQATLPFFDLIRQYGAIGAQAHTHSVMASCPIISGFQKGSKIECHPLFTEMEKRFVAPGVGLYVDSSLGGADVRTRRRCWNPKSPDCAHMVDLITADGYTRSDGLRKTGLPRFGALFIVFNVKGDTSKALAYYKATDGQEVFRFTISR